MMTEPINAKLVKNLADSVSNIPNWFSSVAFCKTTRIGKLDIEFEMRKNDGFMGRFGGGWNWCFGIQAGSTTVILNLFVMTIRFDYHKKEVTHDTPTL